MKLNVFYVWYENFLGEAKKEIIIAKNESTVRIYIHNFGNWKKIIRKEFNSDKFATGYDRFSYGEQRRNEAKETSEAFDYIIIRDGGAWGASTYDGKAFCTAYETLGLHANTKQLLEAWYNLDLPIVDYSGIFGRGKHK